MNSISVQIRPYGCHNRQPLGSRPIPAQDGWFVDGVTRTPRLVPLPFRMAKACEYAKADGQADPRCAGCKHQINQKEEGTHGTTS